MDRPTRTEHALLRSKERASTGRMSTESDAYALYCDVSMRTEGFSSCKKRWILFLDGDAEGMVVERKRSDGTHSSEIYVPIGTRCEALSPRRLHELSEQARACHVEGSTIKTLMLSFVSEDGSVTHASHMMDVEPPFYCCATQMKDNKDVVSS